MSQLRCALGRSNRDGRMTGPSNGAGSDASAKTARAGFATTSIDFQLLMNLVFFELAVQGRGRDGQLAGRGLAVATVLLQCLNDGFPFDFR